MKRLLGTIIIVVCYTISAYSLNITIGDISYSLDTTSKTASVSSCSKSVTGAITIPNTIEYNFAKYSVTSVGEHAFSECLSLTSINIPNSVMSIGGSAFYRCSNLTSIDIPNSVTSIGNGAFWWCSSLTSIEIPNSVTSIGESTFYLCNRLTSIDIPNSVTSIERYAFFGCSSLTSIEIPNSVTSIGDWAFSSCSSLTSINIPNSVTSIERYAFSGCSSLTSIDIPNSVTSIGGSAFSGCSSLTSIEIPNSVTSIGEHAFSGCFRLTSINIPNSVTSIGENAFYDCSSLTLINIPNSVTSIGDSAFSYCSSLTSINIPNSVTSIGSYAFSGCSSINLVVVDWGIPLRINSNVFFYDVSLTKCTLSVPYGTKSLYSSATCWKNFGKIIEKAPIPVTSISLNKTSSELYLGERITLTTSISPSNATNKSVQWTSLNETVATVEDGVVRTKNIGKTIISAKTTDGTNLTATCNISVNPILVSSLSLDNSSLDLKVGESVTLSAIIKPDNATNKTIEWSSSDNSVVSVSNGVVSALSAGTCIVKAKTTDGSNKTATCNVTVKKHPQTIDWNQDLSSIICGGELVELLATSSSGLPIVFSSSDENVASIFDMDNAVYLNPVNSGVAKITATQAGDNYYEAISVAKDANVVDPSGIEDVMIDNEKYVIHTIDGIRIGVFSKEEYNSFIKNKSQKGIYIVNGKKISI